MIPKISIKAWKTEGLECSSGKELKLCSDLIKGMVIQSEMMQVLHWQNMLLEVRIISHICQRIHLSCMKISFNNASGLPDPLNVISL